MRVSVQGTGRNQLDPGQESMGDAAVLSRYLLRHRWPKSTGVLDHYREGETKELVTQLPGRFLLTASLRRRRTSVCVHFLIHSSSSSKLYKWIPGTFWGVQNHEIPLCAIFFFPAVVTFFFFFTNILISILLSRTLHFWYSFKLRYTKVHTHVKEEEK